MFYTKIKKIFCSKKSFKNNKEKIKENEKNKKEIYIKFLDDVLLEVLKLKKEKTQTTNIYILIKKFDFKYYNIILELVEKYKSLNIVSENIKTFEKLEKDIYNKKGIPLVTMNNKRKSLIKAEYIINIDFDEKTLNYYNVNRNAIIFNISENKIDKIRGFTGILINDIEYKCKLIEITNFIGNNGVIPIGEINKIY